MAVDLEGIDRLGMGLAGGIGLRAEHPGSRLAAVHIVLAVAADHMELPVDRAGTLHAGEYRIAGCIQTDRHHIVAAGLGSPAAGSRPDHIRLAEGDMGCGTGVGIVGRTAVADHTAVGRRTGYTDRKGRT